MPVTRAIPTSLAATLAELELHRPDIVTLAYLDNVRQRLQLRLDAPELARRLRRLGWLLPLRVRGAWEFAPADRAGPLSGGDPFVEIRALTVVRPEIRIAIGYESAAFVHSLASRQPVQEVLVVDRDTPQIRSLDDFRRVELTLPETAHEQISGLNVHTPAGILASIAIRPDGFKDWPGLPEWLATAAHSADYDTYLHMLQGKTAAAWSRAAYLLKAGGNKAAADAVISYRPTGKGPYYLGPRRSGGHFDKSTEVVDTVVHRYATATQES